MRGNGWPGLCRAKTPCMADLPRVRRPYGLAGASPSGTPSGPRPPPDRLARMMTRHSGWAGSGSTGHDPGIAKALALLDR